MVENFPRLEIWIEYIMWFYALIPLQNLMDKIVSLIEKKLLIPFINFDKIIYKFKNEM